MRKVDRPCSAIPRLSQLQPLAIAVEQDKADTIRTATLAFSSPRALKVTTRLSPRTHSAPDPAPGSTAVDPPSMKDEEARRKGLEGLKANWRRSIKTGVKAL